MEKEDEIEMEDDIMSLLTEPEDTSTKESSVPILREKTKMINGRFTSMGEEIGEELMRVVKEREKGTKKEEAVRMFVAANEVLRAAVENLPVFEVMLVAVVNNRLHFGSKVEGNAAELQDSHARAIGKSLAITLLTSTAVAAAIDEWILQFPALQELDKEYDWFRVMMETVGLKLMEGAAWGMKARVIIGACSSMTDLLTDVYVTYMFWSAGKEGYFKASLASLAVSVTCQLFVVYGQNMRLGVCRVLKESMPIFSGFKPAVDAYRVVRGKRQKFGQVVEPMAEVRIGEELKEWNAAYATMP